MTNGPPAEETNQKSAMRGEVRVAAKSREEGGAAAAGDAVVDEVVAATRVRAVKGRARKSRAVKSRATERASATKVAVRGSRRDESRHREGRLEAPPSRRPCRAANRSKRIAAPAGRMDDVIWRIRRPGRRVAVASRRRPTRGSRGGR